MPGTSGEAVARSIIGRVPADIDYRATRRRYPFVAARFPYAFAFTPRRLRAAAASTNRWYQERIDQVETLDLQHAQGLFRESAAVLDLMVTLQVTAVFAVIDPLYEALERLVATTGLGDVALLSGSGGAEVSGIVSDLWAISRERLELDDFVRRHGFHGPGEGELSSTVWREDRRPLARLIGEYASMDDDKDPRRRERQLLTQRADVQRSLVAALPAWQRPAARLVLHLAPARIQLRGVAKRAFLQSFDLARASARQAGRRLVEDGRLAASEDIFYLTKQEFTAIPPADLHALVARRRHEREWHASIGLPSEWTGTPNTAPAHARDFGHGQELVLRGVGVSAGVAEGPGPSDPRPLRRLKQARRDPGRPNDRPELVCGDVHLRGARRRDRRRTQPRRRRRPRARLTMHRRRSHGDADDQHRRPYPGRRRGGSDRDPVVRCRTATVVLAVAEGFEPYSASSPEL
jgi:pyruvate,water dikinase